MALAVSSNSTVIFCGSRVLLTPVRMRSRTLSKSSFDKGLKKQISSKRLRNSGLNSPEEISWLSKVSLKLSMLAPAEICSRMVLSPALEVAIIMESRKLISWLRLSRRMPSSRTWSRVVRTEG